MKFRYSLAIVAGLLPLSLFAVVLFLAIYSWPAVVFNGPGFIVRDMWNLGNLYANPVMRGGTMIQPGAQYGILFLIVGTLLTTAIALALAVPAGVGSAIFLAEAVSGSLRLAISIMVELLAAIPSVVFGLWGYVLMIPFLGHTVFPAMRRCSDSFPRSPGRPEAATGF
jgi:phosphate transport system permease protein